MSLKKTGRCWQAKSPAKRAGVRHSSWNCPFVGRSGEAYCYFTIAELKGYFESEKKSAARSRNGQSHPYRSANVFQNDNWETRLEQHRRSGTGFQVPLDRPLVRPQRLGDLGNRPPISCDCFALVGSALVVPFRRPWKTPFRLGTAMPAPPTARRIVALGSHGGGSVFRRTRRTRNQKPLWRPK